MVATDGLFAVGGGHDGQLTFFDDDGERGSVPYTSSDVFRETYLHTIDEWGRWNFEEAWVVGQEVPRPSQAVAVFPDIDLGSNPGSVSDYFMWTEVPAGRLSLSGAG